MKTIANALVGFFIILSIDSIAEGIDPRPVNRMAQDTATVLKQRNFAELERRAEEYRAKNVPMSDGQPSLSGFYAGVSMCVQMRCGDEQLPEQEWINRKLLLDEWNRKYPKSTTAKLAIAVFVKETAWYARGIGYANTVSVDRWKDFKGRIEEARLLLEDIKVQGQNDPEWYAAMLSIALTQGWQPSEFEHLFLDGARKFPYYMPLYFQKAAIVTPRWGGTLPLFRQFVDETVEATKADLGETMYARLNWSSWDNDMFTNGQTDWNRMKDGFNRMTKDYPDPWNINHFAKFACMAGDISTLKQQMAKITVPIQSAWGRIEFFNSCKSFATNPR